VGYLGSLSAPDLHFDGGKEPVRALDDRTTRLAYKEAANLGRIASKVAGMGQLWSSVGLHRTSLYQPDENTLQLHMELHKISTWLDTKFVDGKLQGSWEVIPQAGNTGIDMTDTNDSYMNPTSQTFKDPPKSSLSSSIGMLSMPSSRE
jgi:hypothetical protein